ncbi:hypothetical protein [Rhizobium sp. LCM 4573]|uniref:hypothetical protein n=1 Tax=Rhizobium sp. LCM 4573 TaxID=1848291 RepID=UPI0008DAAB84|nr:hypothetical protein [Rhizobium sp. LCM 4573]OHV76607.1 hypothetical protein LCM4573_13470 [Rhizobium sp. LCM 4573]
MMRVPLRSRTKIDKTRESLPLRWPVLAAAMLIAAFFGLISGVVKEVRVPGGVLAAEGNSEIPHLTKREPLRAVLSADRKDGGGPHWTGHDGALEARAVETAFRSGGSALALPRPAAAALPAAGRAFQPRAPPARA